MIKMFKDHMKIQDEIDNIQTDLDPSQNESSKKDINRKELFSKIWIQKTNYEIENKQVS